MIQNSEILQIRITPEILHYLEVISEKYKVKRSEFVRQAILEKLKRDVPKLREESKRGYFPF
jgi:metal-responsive CopG/Arc/MetJ family transcriptional regulator